MATQHLADELDNLPVDIFELAETGLTVESLTAGHGMPEDAASVCTEMCSGCGCTSRFEDWLTGLFTD